MPSLSPQLAALLNLAMTGLTALGAASPGVVPGGIWTVAISSAVIAGVNSYLHFTSPSQPGPAGK